VSGLFAGATGVGSIVHLPVEFHLPTGLARLEFVLELAGFACRLPAAAAKREPAHERSFDRRHVVIATVALVGPARLA